MFQKIYFYRLLYIFNLFFICDDGQFKQNILLYHKFTINKTHLYIIKIFTMDKNTTLKKYINLLIFMPLFNFYQIHS